jgi:ABC-type nitrate/sulfonate/bicarbonate transport system substrate-binding protein
MIESLYPKNHARSRTRPLRIGFVPLNDCAPIVMARELRLFEKYDLTVELSREIGWATVRDKIIYGELEAAHAQKSNAHPAQQHRRTFPRGHFSPSKPAHQEQQPPD